MPNLTTSRALEPLREPTVDREYLQCVWTFGWLTPLMKKGAAQQFVTEDDLPELVPVDEAVYVGQKLQRNMKKQ